MALSLQMQRFRREVSSYRVHLGAVGAPLAEEGEDFREWLFLQAEKMGVTVAELLIACARDQYLDEKEQEENKT